MVGFLIIGLLFWLAILIVAKESDIHWFTPLGWLIVAAVISFVAEYLLVDIMETGVLGWIVALLVYFGVVFYFLWNNYGGMGLSKIITMLVIFFILQLGYELLFNAAF